MGEEGWFKKIVKVQVTRKRIILIIAPIIITVIRKRITTKLTIIITIIITQTCN